MAQGNHTGRLMGGDRGSAEWLAGISFVHGGTRTNHREEMAKEPWQLRQRKEKIGSSEAQERRNRQSWKVDVRLRWNNGVVAGEQRRGGSECSAALTPKFWRRSGAPGPGGLVKSRPESHPGAQHG